MSMSCPMGARFAGIALASALVLAKPALAQNTEQSAPKILPLVSWVVGNVAQQAFPSFVSWLTGGKINVPASPAGYNTLTGPGLPTATSQPFGAVNAQMTPGAAVVTTLANLAVNVLTGNTGAPTANLMAPVFSPVILGQPDIPVRTGTDAQSNYQGLHLAVVSTDAATNSMRFRSLAEGFKTGDRFKLRAVSTFDAVVFVDNVNPSGVRSRVYPALGGGDQVVFLKAGQQVLLPLAVDQFFEFANQTGAEQLLVTVRDPRSTSTALTNQPVYRQDEAWGSNLMQLTPPGTYAGFTQTLALMHLPAQGR